jgi:predicted histone-like DNA-binding protein
MITYAVKKTRNPKGIEGTDYFAGRAIKTGEYSFSDLAEDINNSTTVTKADAMAVLASIKPFVTKALLSGQVVVLQDLGRLQVTLQGKCYPREALADKEFSPSAMIKGHKILFRPEAKLKQSVAAGIALKRVSSEAMA